MKLCLQITPGSQPDMDSPFEITADKRENMPQRSGKKSRGRRGGRGRSGGGGASKPLTEQNQVVPTRPTAKV